MKKSLLLFVFIYLVVSRIGAQTYVFAQLNGSPNVNTTGWNLTGNAVAGDTQGDADANSDEIILVGTGINQSGGIFYTTAINPLICSKWTVEFDYRIYDGNAADGLAFCFLDVPPSGFVNGQGIGIPSSANGLKVVLDTWNNCGGPNPELQIYYGVGYNECATGIVKIDNSNNTLNFVRNTNYQHVKITYLNGVVTLFINNTQYLTANFTINFSGYMGFTASTGNYYDNHSLKNVIIYTEQAPSDAGPDISYCTSETGSIGSTNNSNFQYAWSPATGLSSTSVSNPTVNLTNTGFSPVTQTYTVTTTLAANPGVCPTTDQVTVTVYPQFQTALTDTVCTGGPYLFNGQNLTTSGFYTANLQSVHGCDSTVTLDLVISSNPLLVMADTSICQGKTVVMTPSGALHYSWLPTIGSTNPTTGALTLTPNQSTNLLLTGSNNYGCSSTIPVVITVNPLPNVTVSSSISGICPGETANLFASGASTYTWLGGNLTGLTGANQQVNPMQTTSYTVTGSTAFGCIDTAMITIQAFQKPVLTITPPKDLCLGQSAVIDVNGAATYQWFPNGSGSSNIFTPSTTTNYQVIGSNAQGCKDTITTQIIVHPNPQAECTASPLVVTADSPVVTFSNSSTGNVTSLWNFGDGNSSNDNTSTFEYAFPQSESSYWVTLKVTNEFGCQSIDNVIVQVKDGEIYYVPNSFTPDADEFNNEFVPVFTSGFDPANFSMKIYNRWGELIFESFDSNKGWDGYLNFHKVQTDTYIWVIRFKRKNTDEYKVISGHVNLIR